jgi:hypothetical protein
MPNTTSDNYTFGKTFTIADIVEEAFERVGFPNVSGYQLRAARRSLNILFQEWGNRGLHYWEVGTLNLTLTQGQKEFNFYRYPSDMPTTGAAALQKSNGLNTTLDGAISSASATSGITLDSITGMNNQGTVRIGTEDITYVGFSGLELTGVTRGAHSTTAATHSDGVAVTNYVPGFSDIEQCSLRTNMGANTQSDAALGKVDRSTYSGYANKESEGTPSNFWVQRFIDRVTMTIYPTPDASNAAKNLHIFFVKRIQDAGTYSNATDVPNRFIPCMVSGLAYYLSQKYRMEKTQAFKLLYEDELARALQEDGSAASTYITPKAYYPNI